LTVFQEIRGNRLKSPCVASHVFPNLGSCGFYNDKYLILLNFIEIPKEAAPEKCGNAIRPPGWRWPHHGRALLTAS
jgi:hypothetical protein